MPAFAGHDIAFVAPPFIEPPHSSCEYRGNATAFQDQFMTARSPPSFSPLSLFSSPPPPTPPNAAAISTPSSPKSRARRRRSGVSQNVIAQALGGVHARSGRDGVRPPPARHLPQDLRGICRDPRRRRRASSARKALMGKNAALLARVEQRFGVPKRADRRDLDHGNRQWRRHGQAAGGAHARDAGA